MTVPKLRFGEFDGDWIFSKIGETFRVTSGSTPLRSEKRFFENADITWVKTTDLNNALITKTEEKISQIALKETSIKILPKGTVFVAMYGGFNQIGRTGLLLNEATCNQALSAIYPNEKVNPFFLLTYLNHKIDDWKSFAASSRKDPNITKSDVLAFPFIYTSQKEQTKIASFLSNVDEKISQLNQKHALLSQYKKGMMQKLFSQQIRFKADDGGEFGEWEDKKLGDICSHFQSGKTITSATISDNGAYPVFGGNGLRGLTDTHTHDGVFALIGRQGALCGNINLVHGENFISEHAIAVQANQESSTQWLAAWLDFMQLNRFSESSAQAGLAVNKLVRFDIKVPSLEEQTKIANFLSAIDQKTEVVAHQIEQAKTWKKGLLQQMFL